MNKHTGGHGSPQRREHFEWTQLFVHFFLHGAHSMEHKSGHGWPQINVLVHFSSQLKTEIMKNQTQKRNRKNVLKLLDMESAVFASTARPFAQMTTFQFGVAWLCARIQQFHLVFSIWTFDCNCVSAWGFHLDSLRADCVITQCAAHSFTFVTTAAIFVTWTAAKSFSWICRARNLNSVLTLRPNFLHRDATFSAFFTDVAIFPASMFAFANDFIAFSWTFFIHTDVRCIDNVTNARAGMTTRQSQITWTGAAPIWHRSEIFFGLYYGLVIGVVLAIDFQWFANCILCSQMFH